MLTGVVGALAARGLAPAEAARLAVFVHGRAGDLCAERVGPVGVVSSDLLATLAAALAELTPRG